VNDVELIFEVDSGSPVSVIGQQTYKKFFPNIPIRKSDIELFSFTDHEVQIAGIIKVMVVHENRNYDLKLYIEKHDTDSIMGREWIRILIVDLHALFLHRINDSKFLSL
jgi:hypothetical protein